MSVVVVVTVLSIVVVVLVVVEVAVGARVWQSDLAGSIIRPLPCSPLLSFPRPAEGWTRKLLECIFAKRTFCRENKQMTDLLQMARILTSRVILRN